ncbi:MAG: AraC family transcriptional regulator [Rhodocyclaceae bacterium]
MDALSEVFAAVRLRGGVFLDAAFTAPWCVVSQVAPEDCVAAGPVPVHLVAYHFVVEGELYLSVGGNAPVPLRPGHLVLLPRNDPHVLGSAPGLEPVVVDALVQPAGGLAPARLALGGGGEPARIVCGFLGCDLPHNPLIHTLPPVLALSVRDGVAEHWMEATFMHAAREFAEGGSGSAALLSKLAELLFVELVRRHLATLPDGQTGWLAGLRDRSVGRALALMHARVTHPWTTEALARHVGLSRSAFAERFAVLLGMAPMHYLAHWRLQLAAMRLRDSPAPLVQIANDVGYESDAAFCRAFKRAFGVTPAVWRRCG